ncbi:putrescine/spermidine ABC transporter ATPase protein [compost metagenome]
MNKLELHHIEKSYDIHSILKFDELNISNGIHWLKGGSGTGKTTFFKLITGETPFNGEVILDKVKLRDKPIEYRSKICIALALGYLTVNKIDLKKLA